MNTEVSLILGLRWAGAFSSPKKSRDRNRTESHLLRKAGSRGNPGNGQVVDPGRSLRPGPMARTTRTIPGRTAHPARICLNRNGVCGATAPFSVIRP